MPAGDYVSPMKPSRGDRGRLDRRGRDRLNPRLVDRLGAAVRPGWVRSLLIRRCAAALLVAAALGFATLGGAEHDDESVMAAAHDLLPGTELAASDLVVRRVAGGMVPAGALRMSRDGAGKTVTGMVRAGEILTDARLLSSRLPQQLTGSADARLVPVRLSDDAVSALLRAGDVVDVVGPDADVLAKRAVVALGTERPASSGLAARNQASAPVVLAMDQKSALRVAAAGLDVALAVIVH